MGAKLPGALLNRTKLPLLSSLLVLAGFLVPPARAQQQGLAQGTGGQIERSRLPDPTSPVDGGLSLGEPALAGGVLTPTAPVTSGDSDLGVQSLLRQPERPQPWSLFADGGFVFTDNVALTHRDTHDDFLFVGEGGASYEWKLSPVSTFSAAAREQYFGYAKYKELDFGSINFALAISYTVQKLEDIVLSAQLGFTRLTQRSVVDNEFYRNGGLSLGAQKLFQIGRAQVAGVGGDIELGLSVPHVAEREEFGLSANYIVQWTRLLSLQAGVRAAYYLYAGSGRQDFNLALTGGATLAFTSWCSLGGTLSGTFDRSDREVFAYDVLNTGVSAFFRLRF